MPSFLNLANCFVGPAAEDNRIWVSIEVEGCKNTPDGDGNECRVSSAKAVDSLLEATATRRRRSVSFSEELDVLTFHVADDRDVQGGDAGTTTDDAGASGDCTQKKKRRSISFNSDTETSTFEVFKDMMPTRDMCDELILKLQEEEKQNEALKANSTIKDAQLAADIMDKSLVVRPPCVKSSHTLRRPEAKRVRFQAEAEVFTFPAADEEEEESRIDTRLDTPRLPLASEATNWNLQVLTKDASRITVSPAARQYLLNMRSLMGEYPTASTETGTIARSQNHNERCNTAVQAFRKLAVVCQSDADTQAASIRKALLLRWQRCLETNLSLF